MENSNSAKIISNYSKPTRLDVEVYIMGEMKLEFLSFLSENVFMTISWKIKGKNYFKSFVNYLLD